MDTVQSSEVDSSKVGGRHSGPVILTGASGLVGRHLIRALRDRGIDALSISRRPEQNWVAIDLADPNSVARLPHATGIIHAAGLTPRAQSHSWSDFRRANVLTTEVLATEAVKRGVPFFVYVSTGGAYVRRSQTRAGRLYVASKLLAERRLRQLTRGRVALWILRPASLYGEYDSGNVARLILAAHRGRLVIPGAGTQRKCLLYAGSLADAIASEIAASPISGHRTESISDLRTHTLTEIVAAIELALGRRVRRLRFPGMGALPATFTRAESLAHKLGARRVEDTLAAARILLREVPCPPANALARYPSAQVPLEEGIRREVEWLRHAGHL